jgi:cation transport regulator ChaB
MGIQGLTLDEVDFEMGVNLLPAPGVNLGLEGKAHIGSQQAKSDDFAFVLEVIEEVPNPLLLSFYLAEVDIKTGLQVFTPQVNVSSLPSFINDINLRDVNVYWADSVVVMPDGTVAQPGLRFSGNLEVLGFAAHAAIEIDQVAGMAGEFETSPIHFHNILSITGKGKGVYLNKKNGKTLPVTVKPNKDQAGVEKVEVVPPGGPVFIFHTLQSPYLKMNIKVSFFSLVNEEVEALVADDAVHFKLILGIGHVANADFDFTLTKTGFAAHSIFGLHLKASIGPIKILGIDFGSIHLDTGFDIQVTIVANEDHFSFKIDGDFEFEGARLNFPTITLSFAPKSLADLPAIILKQVEDHADEIFKDLFNAAAELLKEGIKEAEHLAEEAGKEVAKLASEAEKEAEHLVSEAAQAVEHTAEEAAKAVADVEKAAEKVLADAAEEVAEIGKEAAEEVEKIGKDITHVAEAAEHEVEAIGKEVAQEAEEVGKAVAHLASEAVAEVKAIGKAAEKAAESVLNAANKAAASVVNAAKAVAATLAHEATALWNEAKKLGDAIANAAKKAADAVGHAAKSAWHAISKY